MLEAAIEKILEIAKPEIVTVNKQNFSDKRLERIWEEVLAEPICLYSLESFVKFIKESKDLSGDRNYLIKAEDCRRLSLVSELNIDRRREVLATVAPLNDVFEFGDYRNKEQALIELRTQFVDTDDKDILVAFLSKVEVGTVSEYGDDGVTQKAAVKTGITTKTNVIVPNIVKLKPFRTFMEVDQPESSFIFRLKESRYNKDEIECALIESDGGAWKIEAVKNIKKYLEEQLKDVKNVKVLI